MDSLGRRPLLLFSLVVTAVRFERDLPHACPCATDDLPRSSRHCQVMAISAAMLTFALNLADRALTPTLAITAVIAFVSSFGIGLGPVAGLLPAEIFPAAFRSTGSGLAMSAMWLANFISAQAFLTQAALMGTNAFVPHLAILVLGLVFACVAVPETRGKSLEQIETEMSAT
jgi:MFS family permease